MAERTPEDVAAGILRIAVGGTVREVPTLKAKYVGAWAERVLLLDDAGRAVKIKPLEEWTAADVAQLAGPALDRVIDLIVAYDRTGALGGREWLEENADPPQLQDALTAMLGNAFPLADSPEVLAATVMGQVAAASNQPRSTSGRSRPGTSTRTSSGRASTRSS
jgi:hypothetical protein